MVHPRPTLNERCAETFLNLHLNLFVGVLKNAANDEQRWTHRVKTFGYCGLLEFVTASNLKPKPVLDDFDTDSNGERIYKIREGQIEEPKVRRRILKKLSAKRPGKWTRHRLEIDRERILRDEKYSRDIATLLAYKWVTHLEPEVLDVLAIHLLDVAALEHCLDQFNLVKISSENVTDYLLHRLANELLDKNEKFQAVMDTMKAELKVIREETMASIHEICREISEESKIRLAIISAEASAKCDAAIAEIRERAAKRAAEDAAYNASLPPVDLDPEATFRRQVDEGIARRNAALKRLARMKRRTWKGKLFWAAKHIAIWGGVGLLAFNMEFGAEGTTLVEVLGNFFDWLTPGSSEHSYSN